MKSFIAALFIAVSISSCCCKQPDKRVVNSETMKDTTQIADADTNSVSFVCKLTTPELQKRKAEVLALIKKEVKKREELSNGYRYTFAGRDEIMDMITAFIKSEKTCCGFFNFTMAVLNDDRITLDITGEKGVKDFIVTELEM